MASDKLLTLADVAEALNVTPRTIRNMVRRGELQAIKVGYKLIRFNPNDVAKVLKIMQADRITNHSFLQQPNLPSLLPLRDSVAVFEIPGA
jgi:excisionase family DNA binding protein